MLFNSFSYGVFLPIVFILYWIMPHKYRWILLLISSYYFYMSWSPKYVILIFGITLLTYICGLLIEKSENKRRKRFVMTVTVFICLTVLFIFKYFNFAIESFCAMFHFCGLRLSPITLSLILPVGISFYTFQTLSYVIDIYRGNIKAEEHFGYYATFISFFPQLVAGPIERTDKLLPQIKGEHLFNEAKAMTGLKLMLWGYFKKIVVADTLAVYVDMLYENPKDYYGLDMALVIFFFTIQIYCDFSGYSNIAIGTAKLLGIDLMTNFDAPYFSQSVKEFWKRWHISLSTWLRDYVYIPLGGNRCSIFRKNINILVTFLISGIWHGANWTFLIWGGVHGAAQVLEDLLAKPIERLKETGIGKVISWFFVFSFCNLAWVFFRASSCTEAIWIIKQVFAGILHPQTFLKSNLGIGYIRICYLAFLIMILAVIDFIDYRKDVLVLLHEHPKIEWLLFILLGLIVVFFSQKGVAAEFVYFQF